MSKPPIFVGLVALVALLLLLIFGIAAVGPSLGGKKVNGDELLDQPRQTQPRIDFGNPGLGPTDAELTIVYYGDYQCPSCAAHNYALRQIQQEYPNRIRLVWKDLPITRFHPEAANAAVAARCAGEQGQFWEYHDVLYSNTDSLVESNYPIFALQLGLDSESFEACLQERRPEPLIQRDIDEAIALGVSATPFTFIGKKYKRAGAIDIDNLRAIVATQLGQAQN